MTSIRERMGRDDGMSLAELIVASAISVLLLTMIGAFFTSVIRGVNTSETADGTTRQATTAINTMTQYLHAATTNPVAGQTLPSPAIQRANATDVVFYAYVNLVSTAAQPVMVEYYVDANHNLVEQLWSPTCVQATQYCTFPLPTSPPTSRITLGGPVASTTLFTYFDSSHNATTNAASIDFVGINLELGSTTPHSAGDTNISTTVALLNLGQAGAGTS